jgi:CBS domain containing-hemolysin-like protein
MRRLTMSTNRAVLELSAPHAQSGRPKNATLARNQKWLKAIVFAAVFALLPVPARASIFQGETLDMVANAMSWIVLVVAPAIAVTVFWLIHILPEKIAEKRQHPQAKAIQTLCLLSLFFGGLLWPLAWLWAYSKPVLYKMAYGADRVAHGEEEGTHGNSEAERHLEVERLRKRLAELEARPAHPAIEGSAI